MGEATTFLKKHSLRSADIDFQKLVDDFLSEMTMGLEGGESSLRMIPTYIEADNEFLTEVPVVAIDAGGTNFRTSLIRFSHMGKPLYQEISNFRMPGLEGKISKNDFFQTIAGYVNSLADKSDRIGFCFSYPTEILPGRDGKLLQFCKEVEAPEVVGELIGKSLLEALKMPEKKIVLLNDTVATLLAGKSASIGKTYDSFIGYILGTGTNTCYIERNSNIKKNKDLDKSRSQIINIESGNFARAPRTDSDLLFDSSTTNPGTYTFEKMFSGGYFGGLCLTVLQTAAHEGLFSPQTTSNLLELKELTTEEVNDFVSGNELEKNTLCKCVIEKPDIETCTAIIECLIDRAAMLVAANLSAVILKTDKGRSPDRPVLITVEGTTFYKLHNLRKQFETYLNKFLSDDMKRHYEFTEVPQSSLVGAALAALIS